VAALVVQRGYALSRWSEFHAEDAPPCRDIVLVDAMGVLAGLYCIADIVITAGSLADIGGHNPLEAAICGRGVVSGPYVQNFREIMHEMQQAEAAVICRDDRDMEGAVTRLLSHPDELRSLNSSAALFIQDRAHVLERILDAIKPWLSD